MGRKKYDKLFDNTFGESDYIPESSQSFQIQDGYGWTEDAEGAIADGILFDRIHEIIENSQFKVFNELDENNVAKSLNKVQINEVYSYVIAIIGNKFRKLDIWSTLSDYFNIYPNKFYSSLSNSFKHDLNIELEKSTGYKNKNKVNKLF